MLFEQIQFEKYVQASVICKENTGQALKSVQNSTKANRGCHIRETDRRNDISENLTGGTILWFQSKTLCLRSELTSSNPCRIKNETIKHHKQAENSHLKILFDKTDVIVYASYAQKTLVKP